jgi:N-acetylglucosaminyl-diphospho-decaprenol L-rhamnosyltransferase
VTTSTVAIIVVTFNSELLLRDLVESLPVGAGTKVCWKLIVADNDSQDATVPSLRRLAPGCTIVEMGRNAGYAAGINAAIGRAGDCDAFLVLNPDVRLDPSCIPILLETLDSPDVGIAVPRLRDADGELILSMRREPSVLRAFGDACLGAERAGQWHALGEMVSDQRLYGARTTTDWAEGSTQMISSDCWHACGPWDEGFFLYSEEADFDLRARDAGFATVYEPSAGAVHLEGDSGSSPPLWALLQLNRVRHFRRRHALAPAVAFWFATVLREISRAILGKARSRRALAALLSIRRLRATPNAHSVAPKPSSA